MTATSSTDDQRVRLDKWLWAARFYKTRSLAKEAIEMAMIRALKQENPPIEVAGAAAAEDDDSGAGALGGLECLQLERAAISA